MIQTDEGEKPIQEIEVGDKILAKSDEPGEVEHREVVKLFRKQENQDHFIRHKSILENALGTKYPKYKTHGEAFLSDIGK